MKISINDVTVIDGDTVTVSDITTLEKAETVNKFFKNLLDKYPDIDTVEVERETQEEN